jgi:hypothetical protein
MNNAYFYRIDLFDTADYHTRKLLGYVSRWRNEPYCAYIYKMSPHNFVYPVYMGALPSKEAAQSAVMNYKDLGR